MIFEWDENKRRATLETRGLDFRDADLFFDGRPVIVARSPRIAEERQKLTAVIDGEYMTIVWVQRGDNIRIISMRRAHDDEERAHRALHD